MAASTEAHRDAEFAQTIQEAREGITLMGQSLQRAADHFDTDRVEELSPMDAFMTGMLLGCAGQEALRPAVGVLAGMGDLASPAWRAHMQGLMAQMKQREPTPAATLAHSARVLGDVSVALGALDSELRERAIALFDAQSEASASDADFQALLTATHP